MSAAFKYLFFVYAALILSPDHRKSTISKTGTIKLSFHNTINGVPMALDSTIYTNPFGEPYSITKFKYYISKVTLTGQGGTAIEKESYHLLDQRINGSLTFSFETGVNTFSTLHFLLGVDSIKNVSGAQTGALDPLHDMFWTWNSGYVMAKMEGISPLSNLAENIIQYHIGGFSGINKVVKEIRLELQPGKMVVVKQGQTSEITIEADLNKWWQTPNDIKIRDIPICTTPGILAKKIADNYSKMFTITAVANN